MRGDLVYLALYLMTEIFNYLLAYKVIFGAEITRDKKRWLKGIICLCMFHLFMLFRYDELTSSAMSAVTMIILPVCMLETREMKNFIIYPFIVMGTGNLIASFTYLWATIFDVSEFMILKDGSFKLIFQCIPFIIMSILEGYKKYRKKNVIQVQLGLQQYILFYTGLLCIYFMNGTLQVLSMGNISDKIINICGMAISVACIVFIILILWQGIVVHREIQYKERCEMNEKYMELQEEHFRQLVEQDEKMRKFRHDMESHIQMMKYFCESGKQQELEEYLSQVIKESAVTEMKNRTGNQSVDAILKPLIHRAQEKDITLEIKGELSEETKVSVYDLCTILSNLLKNAIEACERVYPKENRKIEVIMGSYNRQLYFEVKNTVADAVMIENHRLITSKEDKRNHGIGIKNVEEALEKYGGEIICQCKDGYFQVEVSI